MTRYFVQAEPLTVIHIGTGEEFGPMDYTIREQVYYRFRPETVIASLNTEDRDKFNALLDKGNIREIALFLHQYVNRENALYVIPADPSVAAVFKGKKNELNNQLLIHSIYRSASDGTPILPGSSLKGAIRTAILDDFASQIHEIRNKRHVDSEILQYNKNVKKDPFRALKISDCPISGAYSQAVAQFINFKEKRKTGQDFSKMQIFSEIIRGKLAGGDATGWCEIQLDDALLKAKEPKREGRDFFQRKLTLKHLINACNAFYLQNLKDEIEKFYRLSSHKELKSMAEKLTEMADEILKGENQCLIRLGRFSQVENVTLNKYRHLGNNKVYGNTRTITDTFLPAGWVKLTFLSKDEARRQKEQQELAIEQKKQERERIRLEKEKQEALEKAEKERMINMPEDEKMLINIEALTVDPNDIANLVRKCFTLEMPKQVFIALKKKLEELGEWKPAGSKKRQQKIKKRNQQIEEKING